MADDRLEQAIGLVQSGKREAARELLELVLKEDRHNISAWHWYAQTWSKPADKARIWEACLRYNPENPLAQEALRDLKFSQPGQTDTNAGLLTSKVASSKTKTTSWLLWVIIGMLAIFAVVLVKNTQPKDPQQYKHVQLVEYYLYAPASYSPDQEWPLFVGIHGAGSSGM